jgi:GTP-binding protein HflX
VADVTSHSAHDQQRQVESVLKDLEVMDRPQIRVMNKIDLVPQAQRREFKNSANTIYISAQKQLGLDDLLSTIDHHLKIDAIEHMRIRVPQSEGKLLSLIESRAHILKRSYRDSKVQMEVDAPESLARVLREYEVRPRTRS